MDAGDGGGGVKREAPAAARNREPIREVLATCLPASGTVLEIASGTGEHAVYLARAFPALAWQPSDPDPAALASIAAWRDEVQLPNLRAPIALDVTVRAPWPEAAAIVCINMLHISPWEAAVGLFEHAAATLPARGVLYTYGPYRFDGALAPASNVDFDRSLRARDPRWGVRDVADLRTLGEPLGLALELAVAMPANNHSLIFRKQ
ncbi:MAG: DUF938 domain-containing protein [Deltaproteobacteria bacterium]|nr:DUF938 domain-containing protein [Deltaproteobacteria bacterium]MCW5807093.1 DUF938 domain-containing protein [Deltaproteobacteria bacterium]